MQIDFLSNSWDATPSYCSLFSNVCIWLQAYKWCPIYSLKGIQSICSTHQSQLLYTNLHVYEPLEINHNGLQRHWVSLCKVIGDEHDNKIPCKKQCGLYAQTIYNISTIWQLGVAFLWSRVLKHWRMPWAPSRVDMLIRWHIFSCLSKTTTSGRLCSITWSVWMLKSQRILTWSVSSTSSGTWLYHFDCILTPYFLHKSQWITSANLSCLPLYSVWACTLHSLTMWNTVSSAALHILHIGETSDFSIFAFITFIRRDWSCAAVIRPSVSFFSSPLLNHSQFLLLTTSSVRFISLESAMKRFFLPISCSFLYSFGPNSSALMYFCATFSNFSWVLLTRHCKLILLMLTLSDTLSNPLPPSDLGSRVC